MKVHAGQLKRALQLLMTAKRPVFLIGGGVNVSGANEAMTRLAEQTWVPVNTKERGESFREMGYSLTVIAKVCIFREER